MKCIEITKIFQEKSKFIKELLLEAMTTERRGKS